MVKKYYSLRRKTYSFPANTENSIATFLMAMLFLLSLCTTIIFPLAPLSLARVSPYKSFFYLHSSTNSNIRLFINELQQIFAYTLLPLVPQKSDTMDGNDICGSTPQIPSPLPQLFIYLSITYTISWRQWRQKTTSIGECARTHACARSLT